MYLWPSRAGRSLQYLDLCWLWYDILNIILRLFVYITAICVAICNPRNLNHEIIDSQTWKDSNAYGRQVSSKLHGQLLLPVIVILDWIYLTLLANGYRNQKSLIYPMGRVSSPAVSYPSDTVSWWPERRCKLGVHGGPRAFYFVSLHNTYIKHMDDLGIFTRPWNLHCTLKNIVSLLILWLPLI